MQYHLSVGQHQQGRYDGSSEEGRLLTYIYASQPLPRQGSAASLKRLIEEERPQQLQARGARQRARRWPQPAPAARLPAHPCSPAARSSSAGSSAVLPRGQQLRGARRQFRGPPAIRALCAKYKWMNGLSARALPGHSRPLQAPSPQLPAPPPSQPEWPALMESVGNSAVTNSTYATVPEPSLSKVRITVSTTSLVTKMPSALNASSISCASSSPLASASMNLKASTMRSKLTTCAAGGAGNGVGVGAGRGKQTAVSGGGDAARASDSERVGWGGVTQSMNRRQDPA